MFSNAKRLRNPGAMHLFECAGQLLMNMETKKRTTLVKTMVGTNQGYQSLYGLNSGDGEGWRGRDGWFVTEEEPGGGVLSRRCCTLISSIGDSLVDDRPMAVAGQSSQGRKPCVMY